AELLLNLTTKSQQFEEATQLALDLDFHAFPKRPSQLLVPGETVALVAKLQNNGKHQIQLKQIALDMPPGWQQKEISKAPQELAPGESANVEFQISVPANAEITRPYWHRNDPDKENIFTIDDPKYQTLALPPPPVRAHVLYGASGKTGAIHADAVAEVNGKAIPLAVAPAFSVLMQHATRVIPLGKTAAVGEDVIIRHTLSTPAEATVRLDVPSGWQVHPASQKVSFSKAEAEKTAHFEVEPAGVIEARTQIRAV